MGIRIRKGHLSLTTAAGALRGRRRRAGGRLRKARRERPLGDDLRRQARHAQEGEAALERRGGRHPQMDRDRRLMARGPHALRSPVRGPALVGVRAARGPTPPVPRSPWVRTPIDAFILAKLQTHGLAAKPRSRSPHLDTPALVRPDRPAADPRGGRAVPRRSIAERV